jgi:hypothetical protein
MTPTIDRVATADANLTRIRLELASAEEDVALLERLKSAVGRVERLTAEQAKAIKERDKLTAAEARADKAARFAGISDVTVTESPETVREHALRASFTITWTKPVWDGRASLPARHSIGGFGALPPDVLQYLIENCPDRIPAKIMALAPDNPREAFGRYFRGLKRGCIVG